LDVVDHAEELEKAIQVVADGGGRKTAIGLLT